MFLHAMYEYEATIHKVVDGDTVYVIADLGFSIKIKLMLRLKGVNTPEIRGPERPQGLESKASVESVCPIGTRVLVRTHKDRTGKYGRYLANIILPGGQDLGPLLVHEGLAEWAEY